MSKKTKKLSEKAMLTHLSFSVWTGRTKDSFVSDEVTNEKNAEKDSGAWWTYLIPRTSMRKINTAYTRCKTAHNKFTLPWKDGGTRILPSAMFLTYTKAMRKEKESFNEAVNDFLREYPEIRQNARKRLGKLLDHKSLPTLNEVKGKFGIRQEIYPLPDVADFRVELSEEDKKDVCNQMKTNINHIIEEAMSSLWNQFAKLIEKIQTTLGKPEKIFRDSLINNLKDFCILIPKLNLTNDEQLESIRKQVLKTLANLKAEDLRKNKADRTKAAKTAKAILKKLEGYKI